MRSVEEIRKRIVKIKEEDEKLPTNAVYSHYLNTIRIRELEWVLGDE